MDCPNGCKKRDGSPIASTIKGWKRYMTNAHGKWTQEELDAVLGTVVPDKAEGREKFLSEVEETSAPVTESAVPKPDASATGEESVKPVSVKTDALTKKFSGRINKFKRTLAEKFPEVVNNALKERASSITPLSEKETEFFTECIENSLDVLDVDFQITPINKTLTSPLWVLLFPVLAIVVLLVPRISQIRELTEHGKPEPTNTGVPAGKAPDGQSESK